MRCAPATRRSRSSGRCRRRRTSRAPATASRSAPGSACNSGEVLVRAIGNDLSIDYDAVGPTVHLASRMEQLASPGTIRLTAATARLAEGFLELRALGPVPVKGLSQPIEAFDLAGVGAARTRLQAGGRTRAHAAGRAPGGAGDAGAGARAGRGRPGPDRRSGGRRRRRQVAPALRAHPQRADAPMAGPGGHLGVLRARPLLGAGGRPAQALFRHRAGRRPAAQRREGAGQGPDPRRGAASPLLPALLGAARSAGRGRRLAGARSAAAAAPHPGWPQGAAGARKPAPAARARARGPALDRRRDPGPARQPGREPADLPDPAAGQLPPGIPARLGQPRPLQPAADRPARRRRRRAAALEPARRRRRARRAQRRGCWQRARATPCSSRRAVRNLADAGVLSGARGAYRLLRQPGAIEVPASVAAIIAARIDRLEPGREVDPATRSGDRRGGAARAARDAVRASRRTSCMARLAELRARELLYEARLFPDIAYGFRHGADPAGRLRRPCSTKAAGRCTRRVAEALEARDADHLAEEVDRRSPTISSRARYGRRRPRTACAPPTGPSSATPTRTALELARKAQQIAERDPALGGGARAGARAAGRPAQPDRRARDREPELRCRERARSRRRGRQRIESKRHRPGRRRSATAPGSPITCTAAATRRCCSSTRWSTGSRCSSRSSSGCARSSGSSRSTRAAPAPRTRWSVPTA